MQHQKSPSLSGFLHVAQTHKTHKLFCDIVKNRGEEKMNKSIKSIKSICWFCGRAFIIRDGREWKYLCRHCFHYVYEILKVKERPLELRNNWSVIMRKCYAATPEYFDPLVEERLKASGVLK